MQLGDRRRLVVRRHRPQGPSVSAAPPVEIVDAEQTEAVGVDSLAGPDGSLPPAGGAVDLVRRDVARRRDPAEHDDERRALRPGELVLKNWTHVLTPSWSGLNVIPAASPVRGRGDSVPPGGYQP